MRALHGRTPFRFTALFATCAGISFSLLEPAHAEYKGEFIPFPQVVFHSNDKDVTALKQQGTYSAVDFFYSAEYQQALVLAEFYVDHEEKEMERLALGWADSDGNRVWFGRFHTALDQWNRKHHHGAYLQTTIYRPGIIEFEDDGGAIPAHATGVTLDSTHDGVTRMHYTLDVGLGPQLTPGGLRAVDILQPGEGEHKLSVTGAVSRHNADLSFDDTGVFAGYVVVPSAVAGIDQVDLHILGAYSNYSRDAWHLSGTALWVGTRLDLTTPADRKYQAFAYGYLQPEYWLNTDWTLYARVEGTYHGEDNLYLARLPTFVRQRSLVGARYQLTPVQAVKVEVAALDQYGTRYAQALLQWSAAFP